MFKIPSVKAKILKIKICLLENAIKEYRCRVS